MSSLFLKSILLVLFVLTVLTIIHMREDLTCVYDYIPGAYRKSNAIIGLELTADNEEWNKFFTAICVDTTKTVDTTKPIDTFDIRAKYLLRQVEKDYLFISAYGLLLAYMTWLVFRKRKLKLFPGLLMVCLVILFDLGENHFIKAIVHEFKAFKNNLPVDVHDHAAPMYKFAFAKWIILMLVAIYLFQGLFKKWNTLKTTLLLLSGIAIFSFVFQFDWQFADKINASEISLLWFLILLVLVFVKLLLRRFQISET